jgi:pantoate kinase
MSTKQIEDEVKGLVEEAEQMNGLGDVVSKVTKKLGIKECAPCAERRRKLNEMVPFKKGQTK